MTILPSVFGRATDTHLTCRSIGGKGDKGHLKVKREEEVMWPVTALFRVAGHTREENRVVLLSLLGLLRCVAARTPLAHLSARLDGKLHDKVIKISVKVSTSSRARLGISAR